MPFVMLRHTIPEGVSSRLAQKNQSIFFKTCSVAPDNEIDASDLLRRSTAQGFQRSCDDVSCSSSGLEAGHKEGGRQ